MLAGLIMTGHAVLTPMLQALAMLAGDLVTMSRAADRATPSPYPNVWRVQNMTLAAIPLAIFKLCYYVGVLATGWFVLGLDPGRMRTLTFLILVLGGQATTYVLRTRRYLWQSRPATVMLCASLADVTIVTSLALGGVLMTPLAPVIVAMLFGATLAFAFALDGVKRIVFAHLRID
jgi:H+-transporting ATPase